MWLFNKKKQKETTSIIEKDIDFFDDESDIKRIAKEMRRSQIQIKAMQQQLELERMKLELERTKLELDEKRADLYGDYDEIDPQEIANNPEYLLTNLLLSAFSKQQPNNQRENTSLSLTPQTPAGVTAPAYTDAQLRELKSKLSPEILAQIPKIPDNILSSQIVAQLPDIDADSLKRAIAILREP